MKISIVVAVANNNAIGANGDLLWRLPKDLEYFKKVTSGHHVLMGRKTWDSIPAKFRPLSGRTNVIVTRQNDFTAEGATIVKSLVEGVELAKRAGENELMVIGGGEIYRQAMELTDRIYLTKVNGSFENADAFFPELSGAVWKTISTEKHSADEKHKYDFEFEVLERN